MALPVWPSTVPHKPLADNGIDEPHRGVLESEMTAGNTRSRRQFTTVIGAVPRTIPMTTAQFLTFKAFVRDTLSHGSAEFEMPVWDLTACPVKRVKLRDGGRYTANRMGNKIHVSFSLDVWDL
jgi:hypothetical protein